MSRARLVAAAILLASATMAAGAGPLLAQDGPGGASAADFPPVGRDAILALQVPPLVFDPPQAAEHEVFGVPVYHLHDPALPLVDVFLQIRGGMAHFPRERMAALSALPGLIRTGGTLRLPPDSVDLRIDLLALQLSISGGGTSMAASVNALTHTLDEGLELLRELLLEPGFDADALEVWRGQQLEGVRRREDDPQGLAISEFNRLMYGDHPSGWVATAEDFGTDRLSEATLRAAHGDLFCRDRLIVGVSGDLDWPEAEARLRAFLEPWPACEAPLPELPLPEIRAEPGVFVLPRTVEQSTVILARPGGLLQGDTPEYFASRIADHILGAGGFTSRIMSRIRTEQGLAYGANSLWTAGRRSEGILGAITSTRPERTLEATRLLLEIMEDFRGVPPPQDEVDTALEEISNGFVFAFESASQIVSRRMAYRAQELPDDWLERYLEGLQEVTPGAIAEVTGRHLDAGAMTILILGDVDRFDPGLEALGPLRELSPDGSHRPWEAAP